MIDRVRNGKRERLKSALRENLKRRKAQARSRAEIDRDPSPLAPERSARLCADGLGPVRSFTETPPGWKPRSDGD